MNGIRATLAAITLLGLSASPVSACAVGIDRILFEERPAPIDLEEADVIFVHFTNEGDVFDHFSARYPRLEEVHSFVGVAQLASEEQVPVYALVSSCTHGFYGLPVTPHNGDFYLIGQWALLSDGSKAFRAGGVYDMGEGDHLSHWHY